MRTVLIEPLTREVFAPFGDVIETAGATSFPINAGTTTRYHDLAQVELAGEAPRTLINLFEGKAWQAPIELRMLERHPDAATYALDLSAAGERYWGHTLVGATPELLVSRRGDTVTCRPLAGTAARRADPDEDRRAGEELLTSDKNLTEHGFVVDWIRTRLAPLCSDLDIPDKPELADLVRDRGKSNVRDHMVSISTATGFDRNWWSAWNAPLWTTEEGREKYQIVPDWYTPPRDYYSYNRAVLNVNGLP